jgi:hypothetical protein
MEGLRRGSLEKAILDRAWVIEGLKRIAHKAETEKDFSPAIKAHELLGKELGMFVDRKDVTVRSVTEMTDQELMSLVADAEERFGPAEITGGSGSIQ